MNASHPYLLLTLRNGATARTVRQWRRDDEFASALKSDPAEKTTEMADLAGPTVILVHCAICNAQHELHKTRAQNICIQCIIELKRAQDANCAHAANE